MLQFQSVKVTLTDCVYVVKATPAPQVVPGAAAPVPQAEQTIGRVDVTGSDCVETSTGGCRVKFRKSASELALTVGAETYRVELPITETDNGDCVSFTCKVIIFGPGALNNLAITADAGANVAGIQINGNVNINPKPLFTFSFDGEVCCRETDDGCRKECRLTQPPSGVLHGGAA
jgi:hypothetical protein